MTLYEIDQKIQSLVDPETGELLDYDAFAQLQMDREQKIENMALWVKDLAAGAKAIKEEEDNLKERRKAMENKVERLKTYLSIALDGEKFQTPKCSVTFRRTESVQIDDQEKLVRWLEQNGYDDCVKYKEPEVSKTEVGKLLKAGTPIPFAYIKDGQSVGVK